MSADDGIRFRPMYPDVLGAITGGPRIYMDNLQCALGVFPQQVYINQPFEVILVLQNMIDQNIQVKVGIRLPTADRRDNPVIMDIAKTTISIGLTPGEVGVLHVPVVAHPPTQPGKGFPIRVAVRYRSPNPGIPVRPPGGGAPPSVLGISSFKLQALREVPFSAHTWNESAEIITSYFDIVPKQIPITQQDFKPRYETLWAQEQMLEEIELAKATIPQALELTKSAAYSSSYPAFLEATNERFAAREMPLHPGEARAIAKMMAYTIDEAPELETTYAKVESTRWFQTLCQLLAHDRNVVNMGRNDMFATHLYEAVLYEAILMAFHIVQPRVKEDLGDKNERINYATRVMAWFSGFGSPDLNFIYLPLVMGGIAINRIVKNRALESPWEMLDQLREAMNGRMRLVEGETVVVFKMVDELLSEAEKQLRFQRVPR